jgi:hypothetical protein
MMSLQEAQELHGSASELGFKQFNAFATMRAEVVFPTPRGPVNKYA